RDWSSDVCSSDLSFTAQEIWAALPQQLADGSTRSSYVFTESWYQAAAEIQVSAEELARWQTVLEVRDEVNRAIEQARRDDKVGGSLQAEVTVYALPE